MWRYALLVLLSALAVLNVSAQANNCDPSKNDSNSLNPACTNGSSNKGALGKCLKTNGSTGTCVYSSDSCKPGYYAVKIPSTTAGIQYYDCVQCPSGQVGPGGNKGADGVSSCKPCKWRRFPDLPLYS